WQVENAADLGAIGARLEAAGTTVTWASKEDAERRRVLNLIQFQDPDGHDVEVFFGPQMAGTPFVSKKGGTSFVAGNQGLGHFVLAATDLKKTMDFYTTM